WPQAQNYSLTKLRLILAGAMALAIQRFRGSRPVGGRHQLEGSASHPRHRQWEMLMPMANRRIAHPPTGSTARQTGSPRSRLDRDDLNVRAFVLAQRYGAEFKEAERALLADPLVPAPRASCQRRGTSARYRPDVRHAACGALLPALR